MAFGIPKVGEITAQLNEKFDKLYAILVEIRDELRDQRDEPEDERGSIPLALIILIGVVVLIFGGIAVSCDALFEDEQERDDLGLSALVVPADHDEGCWDGECYGGYYDGGGGGRYYEGGGGQDYDQWQNEDRNRNRNRNRGAFSPGPFDRSPVDFSNSCISLDCSGRDEGRRREPRPEEGP